MNILLAVDGSQFSDAAVQEVLAQARPDAQIRIIHVIEPVALVYSGEGWGFTVDWQKIMQEQRKEAEAMVAQNAEILRRANFNVSTATEEGNARSIIIDAAANWPADLVVLGSHGRRGLDRFLLGSVSEGVVRHAPCSVMIVKRRVK